MLSADIIHKFCAVDPSVSDSARPHQDSIIWLASKVPLVTHGTVILAFGTSEFQAKPDAWSKVRGPNVANDAHLTGAAQEDLGAFVKLDGPLSAGRSGAAPAASQGSVF